MDPSKKPSSRRGDYNPSAPPSESSVLHYLAIQKPFATKRLPALIPPRVPTL